MSKTIDATGTDLAVLVAEYAAVKARLVELETAIKEFETGTYNTGTHKVTLATASTFNKKDFELAYPAEAHPEFYYDQPTLLTADIPEELKAQYTKPGATRLTIKPNN